VRRLHLGGKGANNVDSIHFVLPDEWAALPVNLVVQWKDGTLPTPVLLGGDRTVQVNNTFTGSTSGQWMLMATGEDYTAMTKPTAYDCYEVLDASGNDSAEITPSQYEQFVAVCLQYYSGANAAMQAAQGSQDAAAASEKAAKTSETNAATSETNAADSEKAAAASREAIENAEKNCADSAAAAKASEDNAAASAKAAEASETNAADSEKAAAASETNAADSETNAAESASNAASSARTATTQAGTATSKASAAASSATAAAKSATAAATSATNAQTSETNAATSEQTCLEYLELVKTITVGAQGYYATEAALEKAVPIGEDGWWAVVGDTDTIWVWDSDTDTWKDTQQKVDLSDYYTRAQTDALVETATSKKYKITVKATGWEEDDEDGLYYNSVTVAGITADTELDCIRLASDYTNNADAVKANQTWTYLTTSKNCVVFCAPTKPEADFAIVAVEVM
jgi:hypothetical protein